MFLNGLKRNQMRGMRQYNTLIERQTNYTPINMDTTMFINAFEYLHLTFNLTFPQQLIITQVTLRLLHFPIAWAFKRIIPDEQLMQKYSWRYQRYLWNDMERDIKSYRIHDSEVSQMKSYYKPSTLFSYGATAYLQYVMYKALSVMANYPHFFAESQGEAILPYLQHDPTFIMPIGVMTLNYLLLQYSDHPWLINMRQRWTPYAKVFLVMYGSCMSMVLPQGFLISYLTFGITHLVLKSGKVWYQSYKKHQRLSRIFNQ